MDLSEPDQHGFVRFTGVDQPAKLEGLRVILADGGMWDVRRVTPSKSRDGVFLFKMCATGSENKDVSVTRYYEPSGKNRSCETKSIVAVSKSLYGALNLSSTQVAKQGLDMSSIKPHDRIRARNGGWGTVEKCEKIDYPGNFPFILGIKWDDKSIIPMSTRYTKEGYSNLQPGSSYDLVEVLEVKHTLKTDFMCEVKAGSKVELRNGQVIEVIEIDNISSYGYKYSVKSTFNNSFGPTRLGYTPDGYVSLERTQGPLDIIRIVKEELPCAPIKADETKGLTPTFITPYTTVPMAIAPEGPKFKVDWVSYIQRGWTITFRNGITAKVVDIDHTPNRVIGYPYALHVDSDGTGAKWIGYRGNGSVLSAGNKPHIYDIISADYTPEESFSLATLDYTDVERRVLAYYATTGRGIILGPCVETLGTTESSITEFLRLPNINLTFKEEENMTTKPETQKETVKTGAEILEEGILSVNKTEADRLRNVVTTTQRMIAQRELWIAVRSKQVETLKDIQKRAVKAYDEGTLAQVVNDLDKETAKVQQEAVN